MRARFQVGVAALLVACLGVLAGCEEFAETLGCIPPSVLDADDNCVAATPSFDAGVATDAGAGDAGPPPDGGS